MGAHRYKKPEPTNIRGICVKCNKNAQKPCRIGKFMALCSTCNEQRTEQGRARLKAKKIANKQKEKDKRLSLKKTCCEKCGFIPIHICQLDLDHIDGNHENNDPSNHMTLCANCHRLKTYLNRDWNPASSLVKAEIFFMTEPEIPCPPPIEQTVRQLTPILFG